MTRPIVVDTNTVIALSDDADVHAPFVQTWLRAVGAEGLWLPAPCLVELVGQASDAEAKGRALLARYRIIPLDARAAIQAGFLVSHGGGVRTIAETVAQDRSVGLSRAKQIVRTDVMILACAIARDGKLFTTDEGLIKMAARCGVAERVSAIPRIPEQTSLPGFNDS